MAKNGIRFAPSRSFTEIGSGAKDVLSLMSVASVSMVGALKMADTGTFCPVGNSENILPDTEE